MAVSWPCQLDVAAYAAAGAGVVVPRAGCPACRRPMAFEGSYERQVRRAGVVHRIVVQRARCSACDASHALLPDFVLHRRRDSTDAIGAGLVGDADGAHLYAGVPARTLRSWRHRFAGRAELLTAGLIAVATAWAGEAPRLALPATPAAVATAAVGAAWWAAGRRWPKRVPGPWRLASVLTSAEMLTTRVNLPWAGLRGVPRPARAP